MANYINKYPTNLEYDINYLKKYKNMMDFNEYNCYVIRKSEKEILYFYFNMAEDILQLFIKAKKKKEIFHVQFWIS